LLVLHSCVFHVDFFSSPSCEFVREFSDLSSFWYWTMASPTLQSFCCMVNETGDDECCSPGNITNISLYNSSSDVFEITRPMVITYNVLCLFSAILSILGATAQLWPKKTLLTGVPPKTVENIENLLRQNSIICWLAIADLMATIGRNFSAFFC